MSCRPPPSLINSLVQHACMLQQSNKATKERGCLTSAVILPCPEGHFRGKSYQDFKDPTLRVGAVRLHGE